MNFKTRYGYIISDEEVVAFRVRVPHERLEEKKSKHSTQDPSGEKKLTMNLAIWWLHLLAANSRSIQTTYGPLEDEILDGLGRAPTPPRQEETPAASEVATANRTSPAITSRTRDSATELDAIFSAQPSTYGFSFGSQAGPAESLVSLRSSGSTHHKRRRNSVEPEDRAAKRKKGKAKR
ncbi:hypothetical protein H2202_010683 [Exophiala xenobiotica]|nr:hypothetical protein H2202_010683 [Exophiala xenobiotica]